MGLRDAVHVVRTEWARHQVVGLGFASPPPTSWMSSFSTSRFCSPSPRACHQSAREAIRSGFFRVPRQSLLGHTATQTIGRSSSASFQLPGIERQDRPQQVSRSRSSKSCSTSCEVLHSSPSSIYAPATTRFCCTATTWRRRHSGHTRGCLSSLLRRSGSRTPRQPSKLS
jgi:hypothetical protein